MSVMKRVRDISVATLNDQLERSQDPVRVIDQFLYRQRDAITESERLLQQCEQHMLSMQKQALSAGQLAAKREQQAQLALKAGEDQIARLALQEKMISEEKSAQYQELYEQAEGSYQDLKVQLEQLKSDYHEVLAKRQYYAARLDAIRLQQRMNERMNAIGGGINGSVFQRLEDKISDMEWENRSLRDLKQAGREALYKFGSETQSILDRELSRLKEKIQKEGGA